MKYRRLFRINQPLEVFNPEQKIYYKSIIQELADDHIVIGIPLRLRRALNLAEGTAWDFRFTLEDSLCYFRSKCLGVKKEGTLQLFRIARPRELKRVQRRQHYRFPCSLDAFYWVLSEPAGAPLEQAAELMGRPEKAVIVDISGGGLQLVTSRAFTVGSILLLALHLQSKKSKRIVYVQGRVIRLWPHRRVQTHFRHALEYADIPEPIRETIIKFIFVQMRERSN
ncbi:MAG: hypothetical protein GYA86_09030 [Firmicutes bacterium]|nr:hypothetical protein [Bacillota bacterium]